MSDILCVYYSRTGNTRQSMERIARALGAELAPLSDGVSRKGLVGYLRCGLDAMSRTVKSVRPPRTARPIGEYRLVIVGTPVWAGRCSSVARSFLQEYGRNIRRAAWVITRGSGGHYEAVFRQMDGYVSGGHCAAVSIHSGDVGQDFWEKDFLRSVKSINLSDNPGRTNPSPFAE